MPSRPRILIVEDSPTLNLTYQAYLKELDADMAGASTGAEALKAIEKSLPAVVLLDLKLPDMDGQEILKALSAKPVPPKVIVITAHGSVTTAVDAMRAGATDFLLKPFTAERLLTTTRNALEIHRLAGLVDSMRVRPAGGFEKFIGTSPAMKAVYGMIRDAAPSRASVFVMGESGTGKELAAEAIHALSPRADKPFVAINCAAIPSTLMESEIFGHKRGAFTGAMADHVGAAVRADGGTLFLDELCEIPLDIQAKLLRFLQSGEVRPLGSAETRSVNVRFVCATNRNPWEEVEAGRFREDLFYRLHVIPIHMPPLKDRASDVIAIAEAMLKRFAAEESKAFTGFSADAEALLTAHTWPGNVRELGNVIQSAVVLNDGRELTAAMLDGLIGRSRSPAKPASVMAAPVATVPQPVSRAEDIVPLAETERRAIEVALAAFKGKVTPAAKALGVNPSTLYRKMKEWG
ncbi:sigma-54-dependent transcriptional regulator [Pseudokordiimonas caeni]|uniref:sigma-54-dependent transcriptional regulator n=1 Tax=Pseudokordiimonas caeni TaxID=2997908 RepID=UPI002810E226|nr:sigma-54 dependent transcriptional regulator [Pseudokordiimonas caeni]